MLCLNISTVIDCMIFFLQKYFLVGLLLAVGGNILLTITAVMLIVRVRWSIISKEALSYCTEYAVNSRMFLMIMYMIYQTKDENDHWSLTCRTFLCSLHRTVSKTQSYLRIGFRQMGLFFQTAATPRAPLWSGAFKAPSKKADTAQNRFCAVGLAFQKKYSMIQKDDLLGQIWRPSCFQNMCCTPPQNIHR